MACGYGLQLKKLEELHILRTRYTRAARRRAELNELFNTVVVELDRNDITKQLGEVHIKV